MDSARHVRTTLLAALTLLVSPLLVVVGTTPAHAAVSVFPVPTSNANLSRITTAPDGSMWFLERGANKVGRITTAGAIQEFALPPTDSSVDDPAVGMDVGPDGSVWVTTDHGSHLTRLSSTGQQLNNWVFPNWDGCVGDSCPYGGEVRVDTAGSAWVTMNYGGDSFVVKVTAAGQITSSDNSPECADVLGRAGDGAMWCQGGASDAQDTITKIGADVASGVTYPLPSDASYPNALAAGPVGSIWFTRSWTGTWVTSPSNGSVGYLDAASGGTKIWSTGSRSAPGDLVMGPDRQMWFTNRGAAPGIGHISATGVGAISSVGNYEPTSLTFGPDGAVWFTDAKNNSIVRVTTDQLGTTNVDLGDGVTMIAPAGPGPGPGPGRAVVGTLPAVKGVTPVKRGRLPVTVKCATGAACAGQVTVKLGKKSLAKARTYRARAGKKATVQVKLTAQGLKRLKPGRVVKVRVELTAKGSKKVLAKRTIKVRRA
jgi:virginiamycin B lyase